MTKRVRYSGRRIYPFSSFLLFKRKYSQIKDSSCSLTSQNPIINSNNVEKNASRADVMMASLFGSRGWYIVYTHIPVLMFLVSDVIMKGTGAITGTYGEFSPFSQKVYIDCRLQITSLSAFLFIHPYISCPARIGILISSASWNYCYHAAQNLGPITNETCVIYFLNAGFDQALFFTLLRACILSLHQVLFF
jgi:hypothetical protein